MGQVFFLESQDMQRATGKEVHIPIQARDDNPLFWGWPGEYNSRKLTGSEYSDKETPWLVNGSHERVRLYSYDRKREFRFYAPSLREGLTKGNILRLERVDAPSHQYELSVADQADPVYSTWAALCVQNARGGRRYGYVQDGINIPSAILARPHMRYRISATGQFNPEGEGVLEYDVKGGKRTARKLHGSLINEVAAILAPLGAVINGNRIDLSIFGMLIEGKVVRNNPMMAVRHASGQIREYGFVHKNRMLCILLDEDPGTATIDGVRFDVACDYVENHQGLYIMWLKNGRLYGGPRTRAHWPTLGLLNP
jgi:hypothetical protein